MQNVVHEYFKKSFEDFTIIVQVNPVNYTGLELTVSGEGVNKRKLEFDEDIYEDLKVDGFEKASALEFNLYLKGLTH